MGRLVKSSKLTALEGDANPSARARELKEAPQRLDDPWRALFQEEEQMLDDDFEKLLDEDCDESDDPRSFDEDAWGPLGEKPTKKKEPLIAGPGESGRWSALKSLLGSGAKKTEAAPKPRFRGTSSTGPG